MERTPPALERRLLPQVLHSSETIEALLCAFAAQAAPDECYAVVRCGDRYDALALADLSALMARPAAVALDTPLGAVPGLLQLAAPASLPDLNRGRLPSAGARPRRLIVLDERGAVAGLLLARPATPRRGRSPLELLAGSGAPPARLLARFDGRGPAEPLRIGSPALLRIAVGPAGAHEGDLLFRFNFGDSAGPATFKVAVDGSPAIWAIRAIEADLIVAPPGKTTQEALFLVTGIEAGDSPLLVSVTRADSGDLVERLWLRAAVSDREQPAPAAAPAAAAVTLPLDGPAGAAAAVDITIIPDGPGATLVVHADDLAGESVHRCYRLPVGKAAIQNATLRLRSQLADVVFASDRWGERPYLSPASLSIDPALARRACLRLADAGQQVWAMLFEPARDPDGLRALGAALRMAGAGCRLRITIEDQELILPWALLYDRPGELSVDSLDWAGFWGYRFAIEVLPPGRYPAPAIYDAPPRLLLLLSDDASLRAYASGQHAELSALSPAATTAIWGHRAVSAALAAPPAATLLYCYCRGTQVSGAQTAGGLPGDSALFFSDQQALRLADLYREAAEPLARQPVVFLNACAGAAQDGFYYDGFVSYFIERRMARGLIGPEVQTPTHLAHYVSIQFAGAFVRGASLSDALWQLRRELIDKHQNILGLNYSFYGLGSSHLA